MKAALDMPTADARSVERDVERKLLELMGEPLTFFFVLSVVRKAERKLLKLMGEALTFFFGNTRRLAAKQFCSVAHDCNHELDVYGPRGWRRLHKDCICRWHSVIISAVFGLMPPTIRRVLIAGP